MQRMMRTMWAAMLVLALAAGGAKAQLPDVLNQAPEEAAVVIATPSLGQVGDKIAMLNQRLGINDPMMADPLGMLQMMLGIQNGVDFDGSAAIVLLNLPDPNEFGAEPEVAVLVPVTNYQAFLGNFQPQGNGDVQSVNLAGEPAFVRQIGDYALLSPFEQTAENFAPAGDADAFRTRMGDAGRQAADGADIFVFANLEEVGRVLLPQVMEGMAMAQQFAEPEVLPLLNFYASLVEEVMTSGSGAVFGLRVSDAGIGFDSSVQFRAGTAAADAFAAGPAQRPRLDRLPNQPYLAVSTMDLSNLPLQDWIDQLQQVFDGDDQMSLLMRQAFSDTMVHTARGQSLFNPQLGFGGSIYNGVSVALTDDPQAAIQAFRRDVEGMDGLDLGEGAAYQTSWTEGALEVAGQQVHRYSIQMQFPPEVMAELGPAAMFLTQDMGGFAVATDDAVVMGMGSDPGLLQEALELGAGDATLEDDAAIQRARQQLASNPAMEIFVSVASVLDLANEFLEMFMGPEARLHVPEGLTPIAISMTTEGGGVGYRLHIPMDAIDTVRQNLEQMGAPPAQLGFGGGGGGGGDFQEFDPAEFEEFNPEDFEEFDESDFEQFEASDDAQFEQRAVSQAPPAQARPAAPAEIMEEEEAAPSSEPVEVRRVTPTSFDRQVTDARGVVMVVFTADWDEENSAAQAPITASLAQSFNGRADVLEVDVDQADTLLDRYRISFVPTTLIFRNGREVARFVGAADETELERALTNEIR